MRGRRASPLHASLGDLNSDAKGRAAGEAVDAAVIQKRVLQMVVGTVQERCHLGRSGALDSDAAQGGGHV